MKNIYCEGDGTLSTHGDVLHVPRIFDEHGNVCGVQNWNLQIYQKSFWHQSITFHRTQASLWSPYHRRTNICKWQQYSLLCCRCKMDRYYAWIPQTKGPLQFVELKIPVPIRDNVTLCVVRCVSPFRCSFWAVLQRAQCLREVACLERALLQMLV